MSSPRREGGSSLSPLVGVVHYIALLLVVTPAVDFIANVIPVRLSDTHWRYGTVALLSGFLLTPIIGVVLSTLAAARLDQARLLRVLGVVALGSGILLGLAQLMYLLDFLEVRHGVPAEARLTFDVGSFKALGKHLSVIPALLWLGFVNLRLSSAARGSGKSDAGRQSLIARRLGTAGGEKDPPGQ